MSVLRASFPALRAHLSCKPLRGWRPMAAAASGPAPRQDTVAVYVTVGSREEGERIASMLVEQKLAACCNLIPGLTSIYEWQGKIEKDEELLLMVKSTAKAVLALTTAVQNAHSYDECEVIAVPIVGGSESYLDWVADSVKLQ